MQPLLKPKESDSQLVVKNNAAVVHRSVNCDHMGFALAPNPAMATLFLAPASFFAGAYFGPLYSALQNIAPQNMRALAPACATMGNTVLGLGLAPPLLGWLTDAWTPNFGAEAIRYSLSVMLLVHLAATAHLFLAGRTLRGDLEAKDGPIPD